MSVLNVVPGRLSLADLRRLWSEPPALAIDAAAKPAVDAAAQTVDRLIASGRTVYGVNTGVVPCIPAQGSVGASGDLAPLAHLSAVLIGEGEAKIGDRIRRRRAMRWHTPA